MNWTYIIPIVVLTALITASITSMIPLLKWYLPVYITRLKTRFKSKPKSKSNKDLELVVTKIIKDKVNNGLLTYHKKQMIREIVREEVINYLNELKK
jgi:hypothetical protein